MTPPGTAGHPDSSGEKHKTPKTYLRSRAATYIKIHLEYRIAGGGERGARVLMLGWRGFHAF